MTSNQINMLRYLEDQRHNYETEHETRRSNVSKETETHRSNVMQERLMTLAHQETARHNLMQEHIGIANAYETQRHNASMEFEATRSNTAREKENYRHNSAMEYATNYLLESQKRELDSRTASSVGNVISKAVSAATGLLTFLAG